MNSLHDGLLDSRRAEVRAGGAGLLQSLRARAGAEVEVSPTPLPDANGARTSGRRRNNDGGVVWEEGAHDELMAAGKESYRRVQAFPDVPGASGEQFTTRFRSALESRPRKLRATLGTFTTWMSTNIDKDQWPFGWAYGEDIGPSNPGELHYRMGEEQAMAWPAVRDLASDAA